MASNGAPLVIIQQFACLMWPSFRVLLRSPCDAGCDINSQEGGLAPISEVASAGTAQTSVADPAEASPPRVYSRRSKAGQGDLVTLPRSPPRVPGAPHEVFTLPEQRSPSHHRSAVAPQALPLLAPLPLTGSGAGEDGGSAGAPMAAADALGIVPPAALAYLSTIHSTQAPEGSRISQAYASTAHTAASLSLAGFLHGQPTQTIAPIAEHHTGQSFRSSSRNESHDSTFDVAHALGLVGSTPDSRVSPGDPLLRIGDSSLHSGSTPPLSTSVSHTRSTTFHRMSRLSHNASERPSFSGHQEPLSPHKAGASLSRAGGSAEQGGAAASDSSPGLSPRLLHPGRPGSSPSAARGHGSTSSILGSGGAGEGLIDERPSVEDEGVRQQRAREAAAWLMQGVPVPDAGAQQAALISGPQTRGHDVGSEQAARSVEGPGTAAVLSVHPAVLEEAGLQDNAPGRMYSAQVLGSERLVQVPTFRSGRLSAAAGAGEGSSATRTSGAPSQESFSVAARGLPERGSRPFDLASALSLGQQQVVSATDLLRSLRAGPPGGPDNKPSE
jgi:hypothetical protein